MSLCAISPAFIASAAAKALREELSTYPKPGLVSLVDNGSHPEMDAECFLASIDAITPFFAQMAEVAMANATLRDLQCLGRAAETAMFAATGGRNTHKGAIFCLGLLAAAAGMQPLEPDLSLGDIVRKCWGGEIPRAAGLPETTAGIAMCRRYQVGGVRLEASSGFPSIYEHGLPALGIIQCREAARVQVFFELLENCEDTTLLKRGGVEGREFARSRVKRFLADGGVTNPCWRDAAERIHHDFVRRNLTAGGAADLLAATLFVEEIGRHS